jgi:hypothetical protein
MLTMVVKQTAAEVGLDGSAIREAEDGSVWLDEYTIQIENEHLCISREDTIPGGVALVQVAADIPINTLGCYTRAAVALLRAWVNRGLDLAELGAVQGGGESR